MALIFQVMPSSVSMGHAVTPCQVEAWLRKLFFLKCSADSCSLQFGDVNHERRIEQVARKMICCILKLCLVVTVWLIVVNKTKL